MATSPHSFVVRFFSIFIKFIPPFKYKEPMKFIHISLALRLKRLAL